MTDEHDPHDEIPRAPAATAPVRTVTGTEPPPPDDASVEPLPPLTVPRPAPVPREPVEASEPPEADEARPETAMTGPPAPRTDPPPPSVDEVPASTRAPEAPAYAPAFLDSIHPPQLPLEGGVITIVGAAFHERCALTFDGAPLEFERESSSLLRARAPAREAPGVAQIGLANPGGEPVLAMILYVQGPRIDRVSPTTVPRAGGVEITVEGDGFTWLSLVTLADARAVAADCDGPTRMRFVAPPFEGATSASVTIANPDGTSARLERAFAYEDLPAPSIESVEPASAWVTGGAKLTVRGADFQRGAVVRVGDRDAETSFESGSALVAVAPAAAAHGPARVRVKNPDGGTCERADAFRYDRVPTPPKLVRVTPHAGPVAGGTLLALEGDNFDEGTVVRVADVTCLPRVLGATKMEIQAPARAQAGTVAIEIINADGVAVRFESAFTYEARRAPVITSVEPKKGPTSGGTVIVIEGEALGDDCSVRVGRETVLRKLARGDGRIEAVAPAAKSAGLVDVEVVAPGHPPVVAKNAFAYESQPPPVITSVAPSRGGTAGGTELEIEGKAFAAGCVVLVGGKPATKVKLKSPTMIEALTPPGAHGSLVDVVVKNPDGKEAAVKRAFQYDQRY